MVGGFGDLFKSLINGVQGHGALALKASLIDTKLGPMVAIGDDAALYLLEFLDKKGLEREFKALCLKAGSSIVAGASRPLQLIEKELGAYFDGTLSQFATPLHILGTPFQKLVWGELARTAYGTTRSYAHQSQAMGRSSSHRAVANANGANQLALVIPCHRIIASSGALGGYSGGVARKQWLLDHEKQGTCNEAK
jgi:AraC family transcriptional regulator of adaptative response/methylated-DNA-[protein]-cysteine methyltransferase